MPRPRSRVSTAAPTPAKRTRSDAELPDAKRALDAETAAIIASRKERAERLGMLSVLPRDVLCLIAPLLCSSDVVTMHALGAPFVEHTRTDIFKRALFASWVTMSLPSMFAAMRRLAAVMSADECSAMFSFAVAMFECGDRKMLAASVFDPSKLQSLDVACDHGVRIVCMLVAGVPVADFATACRVAAEYQLPDKLAALLKRYPRMSTDCRMFQYVYQSEHPVPALLITILRRLRTSDDVLEAASVLLHMGDIDNLNHLMPKMNMNLIIRAVTHMAVSVWRQPQKTADALCHMLASVQLGPDDVAHCIYILHRQKCTEAANVVGFLQKTPHDPARICELYAKNALLHEAGQWIPLVTDPKSAKRILKCTTWSSAFADRILNTIVSHPLIKAALPKTDLFDRVLCCGMELEMYKRFIALGCRVRDAGIALTGAMSQSFGAPIVSIIARDRSMTSDSAILLALEMMCNRPVPRECVDALLDSGRVSMADVICVLCSSTSPDNSRKHIKEFYQRRGAAFFA